MEESRPLLFTSVSNTPANAAAHVYEEFRPTSVHGQLFGKSDDLGYDAVPGRFGNTRAMSYRESVERRYAHCGRVGTLLVFLGAALLLMVLWDVGFLEEEVVFGGATVSAPTIVFFLVDDMGFNDIAWNPSTDIPLASSAMVEAAYNGIVLDSYYSYMECTPSRSALLTGMYATTLGMMHDCITTCDPFGVPTSYALLPEALKEAADYTTAMVGKWDVGHYALPLWPTNRGFDESLHLSCFGYTDYDRHTNVGDYNDLHDGLDNAYVGGSADVEGGSNANKLDSSYSTFVFGRRAETVIQNFATLRRRRRLRAAELTSSAAETPSLESYSSDPGLFLYVAWNAVHTTLSLPEGYNSTSEYAELVKVSKLCEH